MAGANTLGLRIVAEDFASDVLRGVTGAADGLVGGLAKIGLAASGIGVLAGAFTGLAQSMVSGNAETERYETQLGTLMGSASAAKARIAELAKFGAETPFELPEVVQAEKILIGFGLSGQKAMKMVGKNGNDLLAIVGDIAAGTGAQFADIATLFGKFSSGATGEAISRFQELGIATREQMAALGVQFSNSGELLSPLPIAMQAMVKIAGEKFGGGMQKLSQTFEGQMSTLADNLNQAKIAIMAPIFDVLKDSLAGLNNVLSSGAFQGALRDITALLAGAVKGAVVGVGDALRRAGAIIDALVSGPIAEIIVAVQTIAARFDVVTPALAAFGTLRSLLTEIGNSVAIFGARIAATFAESGPIGVLLDLPAAIWSHWSRLVAALLPLGVQIASAISGWVGPIATALLARLGALTQDVIAWAIEMGPELLAEGRRWGVALIGWTLTVGADLLARLSALWTVISGWIVATAPAIVATVSAWTEAFLTWVTPIAQGIGVRLAEIWDALRTWIGTTTRAIWSALTAWAGQFAAWIVPATIEFLSAWPGLLSGILDAIESAAGRIARQLGTWAVAFVEWLIPALPGILLGLGAVLLAIVVWIAETAAVIGIRLRRWSLVFTQFLVTELIPAVVAGFARLTVQLVEWAKATAPLLGATVVDWGTQMIAGILRGLADLPAQLSAFIRSTLESLSIRVGPFLVSGGGIRIDLPLTFPTAPPANGGGGIAGAALRASGEARPLERQTITADVTLDGTRVGTALLRINDRNAQRWRSVTA